MMDVAREVPIYARQKLSRRDAARADFSVAQTALDPHEPRVTELAPRREAEAQRQGQHAPVLGQGQVVSQRMV
jgi:hypothetical protein